MMLRRNWKTLAPMLTGSSSFSRRPNRMIIWSTSRSGRATPARATTAEIARIDHASASTNGTSANVAGPSPSCLPASARQTMPPPQRARPPQCGSRSADAANLTSVRRLVCSSAIGSRQMFGERTLASPEAV